jgi:hypothetical protein
MFLIYNGGSDKSGTVKRKPRARSRKKVKGQLQRNSSLAGKRMKIKRQGAIIGNIMH